MKWNRFIRYHLAHRIHNLILHIFRIVLSSLIILMFDINDVPTKEHLDNKISEIIGADEDHSQKQILVVLNKTDLTRNSKQHFESTKYGLLIFFKVPFKKIFYSLMNFAI